MDGWVDERMDIAPQFDVEPRFDVELRVDVVPECSETLGTKQPSDLKTLTLRYQPADRQMNGWTDSRTGRPSDRPSYLYKKFVWSVGSVVETGPVWSGLWSDRSRDWSGLGSAATPPSILFRRPKTKCAEFSETGFTADRPLFGRKRPFKISHF